MAVILHREDSVVNQIPPVDLRSAPRIVVKNAPIETSFVKPGAKITARSNNYYACQEPSREEFFKGTYKRYSNTHYLHNHFSFLDVPRS